MTAKYDLIINAGETLDAEVMRFTYKVAGSPVDLTGYSVKAQCKDGDTLRFEWSTANGRVQIDAVNGALWPVVSATETATYGGDKDGVVVNGRKSRCMGDWDLELTSPAGKVTRLLQGSAYVVPEITK